MAKRRKRGPKPPGNRGEAERVRRRKAHRKEGIPLERDEFIPLAARFLAAAARRYRRA